MKTLIVLRHAKSDWNDAALRDFDRGLNARGDRAAAVMGRWAASQGLRFDGLIASSAQRVVQTVERFREAYGPCPAPDHDLRLYLASPAAIADILSETAPTVSSLLLVGHSPGLEDFILSAAGQEAHDGLRTDIERKFPTASVAILEFDIDAWSQIGTSFMGRATLNAFVRPRDVDANLGPDDR